MATLLGFTVQTDIVFKGSGGDAAYSPESTTADASGRKSARYSVGATSSTVKPRLYRWKAVFKNGASTGTLGRNIYLYLIESTNSTGVSDQGGVDETDASIATDNRRNMRPMGTINVDAIAANSIYYAAGYIEISAPYIQVAHWNDTGVAINSTANVSSITLTPVPDSQ